MTRITDPTEPAVENCAMMLVQTWTRVNESALRIQTEPNGAFSRSIFPHDPCKGEFSENARYWDNFLYATTGYRTIRRILRLLEPGPEDVFYDLGCGMGRILCVAARKPMRKCMGVELFEPLCEIARQNAKNLRGRKTPIEVVCGDATTVDLSEGTIYFMFNPFGPQTLQDTLENIRRSLAEKPRAIRVCYYNPRYKSVIEGLDWLVKEHELETFGRHALTIWASR